MLRLQIIKRDDPAQYDTKAISIVVEQLSLQGLIVGTRLASGERVLVLQIGEIERYAGSLIIAARNNPRGVPAIEEQTLTTAKLTFPGIKEEERLNPFQERIVLECVVQLLLEHGICMKHEGLLIFPSMFQPTEGVEEVSLSHSISLYYDFSGAIDNIYSSLVVRLAVSEQFGRFRLWEDRAEFEKIGHGICGLRKVARRNGIAHLDLFFSDQVSDEMRDLFTVFVEEHLRKEGVNITEVLEVICACGFRFQESSLRKRLSDGYIDIICPECETRSHVSEGAEKVRSDSPAVEEKLLALKTIIDTKSIETVVAVKIAFNEAKQTVGEREPIRILHISDLHLKPDDDPISKLQPLIQDLEDSRSGLGLATLDYLVISGDLTNRASAEEFEQVHQVISGLVDFYSLTAERCIIVPGNHDLNWEKEVYTWKQKRKIELNNLKDGWYVEQGDGFLIRDDSKYMARFEDFAKFYHSLRQQQYPLRIEDQGLTFLFEDTRIQFLALNSAWEIDEFHRERSGINSTALSNGLMRADAQIKQAHESKRLAYDADVLRIAVWHHPITGNEKIINDSFIDRLRQADFKLCLHGHIHEARTDLVSYQHPRKIHTIGAGSFGAPPIARPESTPCLYNVLEVERDHRAVRVHTRCLRKDGGAWEGWAVWPGSTATELRTYYDIKP